MDACRNGDYGACVALIAAGEDVNAANHRGTTPLMYAKTAAFGSGEYRILDLLLANGADINARDKAGRTALDYTIERAESLAAYLRDQGACR